MCLLQSLVLLLERSLQAVDPRAASHYWDYTIDSQMYGAKTGGDWARTFFFEAEWFGPTPGKVVDAADGSVGEVRGRFAGIEVPFNFSSPTHNSYVALLRPPARRQLRLRLSSEGARS